LGADVGNLRVSSPAVELDLLLDSEANLRDAISALESKVGSLLTLRKLDVENPPIEKAEAIRLGLDLFNEERYWESHETLESAWRRAAGRQKGHLQGLILIAAALVHWQKNELDVTLSIMKRAQEKLANYQGGYSGIDFSSLKNHTNQIVSTARPYFFKIEMER
jgi:predicted metal-dependent hydrolase